MLIYAIDDEVSMLQLLHRAIAEAAPTAEIADFHLGADVLTVLRQGGRKPDVVFTDIEMPPPTGLDFAVTLKTLSPDTRIVFVTGYLLKWPLSRVFPLTFLEDAAVALLAWRRYKKGYWIQKLG